jgi:hypothetical protein
LPVIEFPASPVITPSSLIARASSSTHPAARVASSSQALRSVITPARHTVARRSFAWLCWVVWL